MDDDENGGLFGIELDSEDESQVKEKDKVPRDFQSEEDFQNQRKDYKPKIEVGDVSFTTHSSFVVVLELTGAISALQKFGKSTNTQPHQTTKSNNSPCYRRAVFL